MSSIVLRLIRQGWVISSWRVGEYQFRHRNTRWVVAVSGVSIKRI